MADPFELMRRFKELERAGRSRTPGRPAMAWAPRVEVFEQEGRLLVRVDLPGLSEGELKVQVTEEGLQLEGERRTLRERRDGDWIRQHWSYGRFRHVIPLPHPDLQPEQVEASFEEGVLEVSILLPPVASEAGPPLALESPLAHEKA